MPSAPKVWFITGTSKGFGYIWAEAALRRGDKVAATARDTRTLTDLLDKYGAHVLPIALDVTDKAVVDAAVREAHKHFGRLDVVVNNAGVVSSEPSRRSPSSKLARRSRRISSAPCG